MIRTVTLLSAALLASLALAGDSDQSSKVVTWTGWFSDLDCAASHAARGEFTENNPECAKTCLQKGSPPVFISEQAKAIFKIKDYPAVIENLGYHLEIQTRVDDAVKTITIVSLKQLEYQGASCGRPRKPATKQ